MAAWTLHTSDSTEPLSPRPVDTNSISSRSTSQGPLETEKCRFVAQLPTTARSDQDPEKGPEPNDAVAKEAFSVFSTNQKRVIVVVASLAAWFSPMTGMIYYPALNKIASDLHVTSSQVNITATTYVIMQGLAPMMVAGFSDKAGRRPAYIVCFTIYILANLALGLQNSYTALLILRMFQSAGISGTIALANGVVGDLITASERGRYITFSSLGSILGPTLSPVLGGLLSQNLGWHWIFWFLLIFSACFSIPLMLFLPETCRKIVDDGSVPPPWSSWNITDHLRSKSTAHKGLPVDEKKALRLRENHRLAIPNPISTLVVLADLETALLLITNGLAMACIYAVFAGKSSMFRELYDFDELHVALMFLPIGIGGVFSAFTIGYLLDWNYRRHARHLDVPLTRNRQTDLSEFPIERARLQVGLPMLILTALGVMAYGWSVNWKITLAGPIISLLFLGCCLIGASEVLNVLLVDIYPDQPATVTAANNLVRCSLGAAATAVIRPMSNAMGNGWAYTTLAIIFLISCLGPVVCMRYGIAWRRAKKEKAESKQRQSNVQQ